jgi:hypothetical protein
LPEPPQPSLPLPVLLRLKLPRPDLPTTLPFDLPVDPGVRGPLWLTLPEFVRALDPSPRIDLPTVQLPPAAPPGTILPGPVSRILDEVTELLGQVVAQASPPPLPPPVAEPPPVGGVVPDRLFHAPGSIDIARDLPSP